MAEYNSRLFTAPKLKAMVEITDDISNTCTELSDLLAAYEQVDEEYEKGERAAAREEIRGNAWALMLEIVGDAKRLEEKVNALMEEE